MSAVPTGYLNSMRPFLFSVQKIYFDLNFLSRTIEREGSTVLTRYPETYETICVGTVDTSLSPVQPQEIEMEEKIFGPNNENARVQLMAPN